MSRELRELLAESPVDKLTLVERGDINLALSIAPCRLKILIVVDGYPGSFLNASFSRSYFGLSAVLDTLRNNPEYFVKFDITRAHRQVDDFKPDPLTEPTLHARYGPHFENFRFNQPGFSLDKYDQVWMFGTRSEPDSATERLSDAELEILSRWMDKGGGLFATGDHAAIGSTLCARVPRARTMRKWTVAQGVPQPNGPNRHDTLRKGHDSEYTFDDESDDIPMRTLVRFYPLWSWNPFIRRHAPHPVLCGRDGVINILPDHPHEGQVFEDADVVLTQTINFGTYTGKPEYPTVSGTQTRPEVIAHARVRGDHTATDFKGIVNPRTFGAIGAYNGHRAKVGRVVVDSTWHHWFDVNLTGRPVERLDSDPQDLTNPKTQGFLATTAGINAYARIQNYFRNVAMWLASPAKQKCMFMRATWGCVLRYPLAERLQADLPLHELGESARDAIGRIAGQCALRWWILDVIPTRLHALVVRDAIPFPDPNPCLTCPPFELFETYALGGIVREFLTLAYKRDARSALAGTDEQTVARLFVRGMGAGLREVNAGLTRSVSVTRDLGVGTSGMERELPLAEHFLGMDPQLPPPTVVVASGATPKAGSSKAGAARKPSKKSAAKKKAGKSRR